MDLVKPCTSVVIPQIGNFDGVEIRLGGWKGGKSRNVKLLTRKTIEFRCENLIKN